jgi:hypothetical protein
MKRKRFKAEQIVLMLRGAEVQISKGLDIAQVRDVVKDLVATISYAK